KVASSILSTLIACLPNESKELLYKNKISISLPTSKPPVFNYASFCKVLSIYGIYMISTPIINNRDSLVANEIIKMFMNQISSLKKFICSYEPDSNIPENINFTYFSGMRDL